MNDSKLKQRLIGAFVLIILVVIFVPMLLDEPRESSIKATNIPAQPQEFSSKITPLDEPLPIPQAPLSPNNGPAVVVERTPGAASSANPAPAARSPGTSALATPDQPPEPEDTTADIAKDMTKGSGDRLAVSAWVVQLGSFSKEENALKLRDQLRAKGYTTFVESVDAKGVKVFRVRIGPELDRTRAEAIREKLEKELKITGIVGRYPS